MPIESDLRTYLLSQPAISALVGTRVHPRELPQGGTFPAITYQRIGGAPGYAHDTTDDLARGRFQIDCWSQTYGEAAALGAAVKTALKPENATALGAKPRILNEMDLQERDVALWRRNFDVAIWHKEA